MCLEIILVLAFLLVPVIMVLGLTYTGVWVQNGGMNQTAIAMHTYLALSTMDLFSNNVQVNSSTVAASLTPAVFTGYAQQIFTTTPAPVNDITLWRLLDLPPIERIRLYDRTLKHGHHLWVYASRCGREFDCCRQFHYADSHNEYR